MNGYLEINEAINITGLNEKTLTRFITAGYIQTLDQGNTIYLKKIDLSRTFGLEIAPEAETSPAQSSPEIAPATQAASEAATAGMPKMEDPGFATPQPQPTVKSQAPSEYSQLTNTAIWEQVIALQDRLIDEKDTQLTEQQNEIKWLRARIEKLEDQSEKDKILLLSGNQTINRLIEIQGQKKGWWEKTITWLGAKEE